MQNKKGEAPLPKQEKEILVDYTKVLLSRWARRTARLYTVADSFAAAAVGARRFLQHSGSQMTEKTRLVETQLAYNLAELAVESNHIKWRNANGIKDQQGRLLNIPGNSKEARIISVERLKENYLHRAEIWSPAHATKASAASKKMKKRRSKFLSVFMDGNSNDLEQQTPKPSKSHQEYLPTDDGLGSRDESRRRGTATLSPRGRRGSAEALLQSVLDECESLIDGLKVSSKE